MPHTASEPTVCVKAPQKDHPPKQAFIRAVNQNYLFTMLNYFYEGNEYSQPYYSYSMANLSLKHLDLNVHTKN